ncbi:MAG TPA: NUDIX domain-containing protein [Acidimicrobiales bacterium]|nr:NUDIX domain-containing protein [Acidimicrobiales bacterium]
MTANSSHEPKGYECPFCRIASGHLPERVVYRNDAVMTLVNIKWWPNNPGGCLVVPIEHHENVFELPARLGTPIQAAVREVAVAMKSALGCDGISTRQHNEPAGNQDVWHHHTHVFPRWHGDDLYRSRGATVPMEEVNQMAALLRSHLPAPDLNAMLPAKPAAAGVVLTDADGRILVVRPTYRETWGIPGGGIDRLESPREGCIREIREELGLDLEPGELLAYEHRVNAAGEGDAHRFLFDGPVLTREQIAAIRLPADELSELRFVTLEEAVDLLEPALGRRLQRAVQHRGEGRALYLEDGQLVPPPAS